jgi:hypothetical protein
VTKRSLPQTCEEIFEKALSDVLRGVHLIKKAAQRITGSVRIGHIYCWKIHHGCGRLVPPTVKSVK